MRKLARLFTLGLFFAVAIGAQSGRRVPPPPPAPPVPASVNNHEDEPPTRPARETVRVAELEYVPEEIADAQFKTLKRESFRLADYKNKVVVLNIWASWCGPCRRETPELDAISREYAARGVEFVGLTAENPASDDKRVQAFVRDSKISYRVGWIDRASATALMNGRNSIPQTFVIKDGREIVGHLVGYGSTSATRLRALIDRALSNSQ